MCGQIKITAQRIVISKTHAGFNKPGFVITYKPGDRVAYINSQGVQRIAQWTDPYWARSETRLNGSHWDNWTEIDIPADSFWERKHQFKVKPNQMLQGLLDPTGQQLVIVTRASTIKEKALSKHHRMAVTKEDKDIVMQTL